MVNLNKKVYTNRNTYVYGKYYFELKQIKDKKILSYDKIVRHDLLFNYIVSERNTKYKTYNKDISLDMVEKDIVEIGNNNIIKTESD